jgi:hypothetical protein
MRSRPVSNGVRLTLNVKPLRSETKLFCEPDGTLTIHVAAPPMKGEANREIVRWLSKPAAPRDTHTITFEQPVRYSTSQSDTQNDGSNSGAHALRAQCLRKLEWVMFAISLYSNLISIASQAGRFGTWSFEHNWPRSIRKVNQQRLLFGSLILFCCRSERNVVPARFVTLRLFSAYVSVTVDVGVSRFPIRRQPSV